MPLSSGARLGPYEIQAAIGAGGMGEVYKARDTRLDRSVAIKVLPAHVSADPERRARFEREAKTIAGLSHPHICPLYDVGEHEGSTFLVMEHLTGETLAQRLEKGPLPLEQGLTVATEIADALAAAHRQGVIHRDLKPGNVMLTKTGAKLLDFGLAKLKGHGEQPAVAHLASAPTQSTPLTGEGMIVGTLQYMAPEQLEGKPADARTDLWALGAILYEVVTGKRAFEGTSAASLIASILDRDPAPLAALQPLTPPGVDRIVRRCLAKQPEDRWDTAHDVADELRWLREVDIYASISARPRRRRALGPALCVVAGFLLGLVGAWVWLRPNAASSGPIYATIPLTTDQAADSSGQYAPIAVSPNGQLVVFLEGRMLVRRPLSSFATTPIAGTQGAASAARPAFSPDGTALAFVASGRIKQVPIFGGGSAADVAVVPFVGPGLTWGEDNRIYYSAAYGGGIWRVPVWGEGKPETVTRVQQSTGESDHAWPQLLPGGKVLLYTALGPSGGADDARVVVEELSSHQRTTVADKAMSGRYVQSGHLIYARNDGVVYAAPFDLPRLRTTATPGPVLPGIGTGTYGGAMFLAVSSNGTVAFLTRSERQGFLLRVVDEKGQAVPMTFDPASLAKAGLVLNVRTAPDGQRYAFTGRRPGGADVWTFDARTAQLERVTFGPEEDEFPVWSPDGERIVYTSAQPGTLRRILIKTVGSRSEPTLVKTWPRHVHVTSWSPDGRWLTVMDVHPVTGWDLWAIAADGSETVAFANGPAYEGPARFSPDGRWIAYVSNETGQNEVYVTSFPVTGTRRQVSTEGGSSPVWDPDGRTLYYIQAGYVVAQEVRLGTEFSKGRVTRLFPSTAATIEILQRKRFVLMEPNTAPPDAPLHLIVNWFEDLKAKVPTGR